MTKEELKIIKLEEAIRRIEVIKQLPSTATLAQVILKINEITDSIKRR